MKPPTVGYVLGSGWTLPVDDLPRLSGSLTIGVNYILRSGFVPTALLWSDAAVQVNAEYRDEMLASGAMLIAPTYLKHRWPGAVDEVHWISDDYEGSGNSGVSAAVLMFRLGVVSVQMLGCSCTSSDDGRVHFYETARPSRPVHTGGLYNSRNKAQERFGDLISVDDTIGDVGEQYSQDHLRSWLVGEAR